MAKIERVTGILLLVSVCLNLLLIPVAVNAHLRFTYQFIAAHWLAKLIPPKRVFVGDSITAGGGMFGDFTNINLATNGLQTYQIVGLVNKAKEYNSDHIIVMAGTNDAIEGNIDTKEISALFDQICKNPQVVVALAPATRSPILNERLNTINRIALNVCLGYGRPIIRLDNLSDPDGLLGPEYTTDGTHLSDLAYDFWVERMHELGI